MKQTLLECVRAGNHVNVILENGTVYVSVYNALKYEAPESTWSVGNDDGGISFKTEDIKEVEYLPDGRVFVITLK